MKLTVVVFIVALVAPILAQQKNYEGYKTYQLVPNNGQQLKVIQSMSKRMDLDFWSNSRQVGKNTTVMVKPQDQNAFITELKENSIKFSVLINNVQESVSRDKEAVAISSRLAPTGKISFTQYYRYDDIVAYVKQIATDYPNLAKVSTIGTTYEGRAIVGLTISSGGNGQRNALLIEGGIHAREWIAPATVLYLINQLVENYATNKALVDGADWLLVPVTNPDGYEYTQTDDRFWRKNRSPGNVLCKGTDANRNFGFQWGGEGASTRPCDETYRGASAFSEKESSAIRDFGLANQGRVKVYLAMHSYGPYFLYPWGYQWDLPDDWQQLDALAQSAAAAIRAVNGTRYEIGSSTQVLYAAAGGSDDYMKGGQNVAYSYTIELPGGGSQGFDPPPSSILPIVRETFEGLKVVGKFAATL